MYITIRRIVALQALVLTAAAGPAGLGQSSPIADPSTLMPIGEFEPAVAADTSNSVSPQTSPGEIGPLAQALGTPRAATDNFPPAPSRNEENPMLTAVKALSDQVKSLESRIVAQDSRIAMLERTLNDLQH